MSAHAVWQFGAGEEGFPGCVAQLEMPVRRLYGVGNRELLLDFEYERAVAIVGSRRASGYGIRVATELGRDLAAAGVTVVSGLARGIDAAAHRGALAGGGAPVAVLASGPDLVYPPMHRELHAQVAARGAVVSEYPPATEARKHRFLERNRIMAALAKMAVIVEAAQPSGSLVTAAEALRLDRAVGAVPGQVGTRNAEGTNALLRDGAHVIRHATDVLDALFDIDHDAHERFGAQLEPHLRRALELVEQGATSVDELVAAGGLEPREAAVSLAHLELLGYISAGAGGEFARLGLAVPPQPAAAEGRH